jgi:hypothetical protein
LRRIDESEEIEIAAVRSDGTLRAPRPIWVVRVGDDLFVRAAYGEASHWHRAARASGKARIRAAGIESGVGVEDARATCSIGSMPRTARSTAATPASSRASRTRSTGLRP